MTGVDETLLEQFPVALGFAARIRVRSGRAQGRDYVADLGDLELAALLTDVDCDAEAGEHHPPAYTRFT